MKVDSQISADRGYRGLAVDCVSFDSRYRSIFTYLLGRVAVVDNMDTAIKLSKMAGTGIRFVTLDGEIINASGQSLAVNTRIRRRIFWSEKVRFQS